MGHATKEILRLQGTVNRSTPTAWHLGTVHRSTQRNALFINDHPCPPDGDIKMIFNGRGRSCSPAAGDRTPIKPENCQGRPGTVNRSTRKTTTVKRPKKDHRPFWTGSIPQGPHARAGGRRTTALRGRVTPSTPATTACAWVLT